MQMDANILQNELRMSILYAEPPNKPFKSEFLANYDLIKFKISNSQPNAAYLTQSRPLLVYH